MNEVRGPWWCELNRYHWFVLVVAALGWLFDTMDQQLFTLARTPAMRELLAPSPGVAPDKSLVDYYGGLATSIFLIGWATGGITFGVLGDRIGRARTMIWTILVYSLFTGLSALSRGFWDFALYRFLTGLGVGGEFAVGVALVAEVMPARARPFALGLLQALSAVGNIAAALIGMGLGLAELQGQLGDVSRWRIMFVVGTLPALLALLIRRRLKEPERWQASAAAHQQLGSMRELVGDERWRRRAIVGVLLASAGVIGLWGVGFFSPELLTPIFRAPLEKSGLAGVFSDGFLRGLETIVGPVNRGQLSDREISGWLSFLTGIGLLVQNVGGFFGIYAYTYLTHYVGRRIAFAVSFLAALASTLFVFASIAKLSDVFWMLPLMGFCQLALFGGYAIYFPELFPTRLRSTGTSLCYNVGRYVAAVGPFTFGVLAAHVYGGPNAARYAGMTMCSVFLLGIAVLPFAPETKDQPLPE